MSATENGLLLRIVGVVLGTSDMFLSSVGEYASYCCALDLLGSVFMLVGLVLMFIGRNEFGEEHRRYIFKAFILFLIWIAVGFGVFLYTQWFFSLRLSPDEFVEFYYILLILNIITMIFGLFINYYTLYHLESRIGRVVLWLALFFMACGPVAAALIMMYTLNFTIGILFVVNFASVPGAALLVLAMVMALRNVSLQNPEPDPDLEAKYPTVWPKNPSPCPDCGEDMLYMPGSEKWYCGNCEEFHRGKAP